MSKICIKCGAELEDDAIFCDECGEKQIIEQPKVEQIQENQQKKINISVDVNEKQKHSGFGIASLILGILSIITLGGLFIPEILGIIFGIIGIRDKTKKHGLAIAGLVTSIIGLIILILLVIIGSLA